MLKLFFIMLVFMIILYLYLSVTSIDNFCYDLIEERDNKIFVYNTKTPITPGLNPVKFNTLDEYKFFEKRRKEKGYDCPVLHFKRKYTTQNEFNSELMPDPESGYLYLPKVVEREKKKYKKENLNLDVSGFDPTDQDIGKVNKIDMKF